LVLQSDLSFDAGHCSHAAAGLRCVILKAFPKSVLMSGAAGIGVFIAFVGAKDSGFIAAAPFPTLLGLNVEWPYKHGELLATRSWVVSRFVTLSAH
jgi:xanthine/uracil/vitamin C permease (AzgA family)